MLEDVEPGWEGHVLAGNCEYAEGEGDPDKINAASRLYALWERQGRESREDLSCDTEHAESEGETEKTHAGRTMLGAGIDPCWERTACRLVAFLLEETQEEQERQGTASGQDAPLHGLQPGRMSHGSSDEDDAKRRATAHRKAWQKEYDAKRRATPHRKAYKKEYNAKYRATPHGKAYKKENQAKYRATLQYKAWRKEYEAKRQATPHGKAKLKEYDAKHQATPQYKAYKKEYDAKRDATPHRKAYKKAYNAEYRKRRRVEAT